MEYVFKGTPGPWRWEVNEKVKSVSLCGGKPMFDLTVMNFDRWGMRGAAPNFRGERCMDKITEFTHPVKGMEHHSYWFKGVDHPDANLIAAAPELLAALIAAVDNPDGSNLPDCDREPWYGQAKAAIHKALNINQNA